MANDSRCGQTGLTDRFIPLNHPESGGSVPILTTLSRYPAEHSACPEFFRRRSVRFFRLEEQFAHRRRQNTHALFCCHSYKSSGDSLFFCIAMQSKKCVIRTHTEIMVSVASSAHAHIYLSRFLVRNSRIYTNMVPLCILDRLRGMQIG